MRLTELVGNIPGAILQGDGSDPEITSASYDSRSAGPGSIFVAVAGFKADGHDYLKQAVLAGASAVAVQVDRKQKWSSTISESPVPAIIVPDARPALARVAAALANYPARGLRTIGVTGTDGKTSVSHLLHHMLSSTGERAGLISTAECRVGDKILPDTGRMTTPEAPEVQQILSEMVGARCRWSVIEATSHGLSLHRVDECEFDAIIDAIHTWRGAPGRMELIEEGQPFTVIVDFAHAPEALKRVLTFIRGRSAGRIIAVFGCIGERDKDRRFGMGRVAAEYADFTIVTDDNPYSEDRNAVIAEIARGLRAGGRREGHDFAVIPDRREAIAHALGMAVDGDAVLLAGKGHEREVHLPDAVYPCHDPRVARAVLRGLGYGR